MPHNVQLPDGRTVVIPDTATADQLAAFRVKLGSKYANVKTGAGMRERAEQQASTTVPPSLQEAMKGFLPYSGETDPKKMKIAAPSEISGMPGPASGDVQDLGLSATGLGLVADPIATLRGILAGGVGAYGGGKTGGYLFGPKGETAGKFTGGLIGSILGYRGIPGMKFNIGGVPISLGTDIPIAEQMDTRVAEELAHKAARIRAGLEPPAEDTIAEVLRQEFLEPPKKSGIPQDIPLPKAKAPTYVPKGVPGFEEPTPEVSKLSEGPTALQHQVAREQALEDIRNATINRPGWVAKLPTKAWFKKASPDAARKVISDAIVKDPVASNAIREGSRLGSAGDLASWTKESIMEHYVKELSKGTKANPKWLGVLKNEYARRGLIQALPGQVRP